MQGIFCRVLFGDMKYVIPAFAPRAVVSAIASKRRYSMDDKG
jgi:hypothetical protein